MDKERREEIRGKEKKKRKENKAKKRKDNLDILQLQSN
jgi:hypothetical protein